MSSARRVMFSLLLGCCLSLTSAGRRAGQQSSAVPVVTAAAIIGPRPDSMRCEVARIKCAQRQGCGLALQHYMVDCADLIAGKTEQCHIGCQRALIALVSSDEGQALMDCDCHGSSFCELSKERIEVCRPDVLEATAEDSIVSCATARWICLADVQCSTALGYYHNFCRSMFKGSRCTYRCKNSLDILNRQEKAAKLKTCYCDGSEDFPCQRIKSNTERLCNRGEEDGLLDNEVDVSSRRSSTRSGATISNRPAGHLLLWAMTATLLLSLLLGPSAVTVL